MGPVYHERDRGGHTLGHEILDCGNYDDWGDFEFASMTSCVDFCETDWSGETSGVPNYDSIAACAVAATECDDGCGPAASDCSSTLRAQSCWD